MPFIKNCSSQFGSQAFMTGSTVFHKVLAGLSGAGESLPIQLLQLHVWHFIASWSLSPHGISFSRISPCDLGFSQHGGLRLDFLHGSWLSPEWPFQKTLVWAARLLGRHMGSLPPQCWSRLSVGGDCTGALYWEEWLLRGHLWRPAPSPANIFNMEITWR